MKYVQTHLAQEFKYIYHKMSDAVSFGGGHYKLKGRQKYKKTLS